MKKNVDKFCYRCKISFIGTIKSKFCSKPCQYGSMSERMRFQKDNGTLVQITNSRNQRIHFFNRTKE